jgi:hypothetical protein
MTCPACSAARPRETAVIGVYECRKCSAVFGQCYKGDSYRFVLPYWHEGESADQRYFDLTTLGSGGVERSHGWVDATTRRITQVG